MTAPWTLAVALCAAVLCACTTAAPPPAARPTASPSAPPTADPLPSAPPPPVPSPVPSPGAQAPLRFATSYVVAGLGPLPDTAPAALLGERAVAGVVAVRIGDLAVASGLPAFPEVPVEAVAVEPAAFGAASGAPGLAAALRRGAVLSRTSASLRGVGPGGEVRLVDGRRLPVAAVVEDTAIGGYEVAVDQALGSRLGLARLGYVLVQARDGATPGDVRAAVRRVLPQRALRVRTPGERPYARRGDEVLPQAQVKARFGEFAVRRTAGGLVQDPAWAAGSLVVADVPLLGRFRCHRRLVAALVPAMREVQRRGLAATVRRSEFGGCHSVRAVRGAASLSRHSWGAAVDLNADSNPLGAVPTMDRRLVAVLEAHGLRWGGRFLRPDGQHLEGYR